MSIMVGIGRGAREGVLIKNAEVLETMRNVDTLIVDKTGTLTLGKPAVVDVLPMGTDCDKPNDLLFLGASVEKGSEHPLGKSLVQGAG